MRLASIYWQGEREIAAIVVEEKVVTVEALNRNFHLQLPTDMLTLIAGGELARLLQWYQADGRRQVAAMEEGTLDRVQVRFAPLYRRPRKIWGIGLNYVEHAADLQERPPEGEPASFMKPDTTIIGPGDAILIPRQSDRTTAEAELGVIIGKQCKNVPREQWLSVVAGFTTIIDVTAEDILQRNPRYLTRAKSFDTFFSFGPELVTPEEVESVPDLKVATVVNGEVRGENVVANMQFPPDFLVAFHSEVMTLLPGDIISTGTPRAAVIGHGDVVECRIEGFTTLTNEVVDLKRSHD